MSSFASSPLELNIRVHYLKGLPIELSRKHPKGTISIDAELGSGKCVTSKRSWGTWGGAVKNDEVTKVGICVFSIVIWLCLLFFQISWPRLEGILKWEMELSELNHIKTYNPKLKLNIRMNSENFQIAVGYALIDLRDEYKEPQWLKIHGMIGAELEVSSHYKVKKSPNIHLLNSMDSMMSAIPLEASSGNQLHLPKYGISVALEKFQSLDIFSNLFDMNSSKTFWLSWTLLNTTFQTNSISREQLSVGPTPVKDTVIVQCSDNTLMKSLIDISPLRIFLCTTGKVLAVAEIPFSKSLHLPYSDSNWYPLVTQVNSTSTQNAVVSTNASIYVSISIDVANAAAPKLPSDTLLKSNNVEDNKDLNNNINNSNRPVNRTENKNNENENDNYDDEGYEDDDEYHSDKFEDDADNQDEKITNNNSKNSQRNSNDDGITSSHPPEHHSNDPYPSSITVIGTATSIPTAVHGADTEPWQDTNTDTEGRRVAFADEVCDSLPTTSLAPPSTGTHRISDTGQSRNSSIPSASAQSLNDVMPPHLPQPQQEAQSRDTEDSTELHHYRLSLDICNISSLQSAAHVSIQFSYPFLGIGAHVRNHPVWIVPHATNTKLENASAVFDCYESFHNFLSTLNKHPLNVSVLTRSNLGVESLGTGIINLAAICDISNTVVSYRCPITKKSFKSKSEYARYRQAQIVLQSSGGRSKAGIKVPPECPVTVRCMEYQVPVIRQSESGATSEVCRLRAVLVLEDMGKVDPQYIRSVKRGYKMHHGAVYESKDETENGLIVSTVDENDMNTQQQPLPPYPLDRSDLSVSQRMEIESLRIDWECWRKAAESQWRENLRLKELELRQKLESEAAATLADRADDLRRAQEEAARLEVRLRTSIDAVERQKTQLLLKEEQMTMKLAQRTSELQLLQRRVREDANTKVEMEQRKVIMLESQISALKDSLERAERRAKEAERDYDTYRQQSRSSPENLLREETIRLKAQMAEMKAELEKERRLKGESELEKEHYRAQVLFAHY